MNKKKYKEVLMKINKTTNIYNKLEREEKAALQKILNAGYKNPYDEFRDALVTGLNKRFLKDLRIINYGDIEENQVSVDVIFEERCTHELLPLIQLEGLRNPPIVEEAAIPGKYKQVTGHHRAFTMDMKDGFVPVIVVTKNYNLGGVSVPSDIGLIQGIRANPPQECRAYTMEDAVLMVQESLKLNPTQNGLNPSGKLPPRSGGGEFDFDNLLNRLYSPRYFPHKSSRTKIYNRVKRKGVISKLIPIDFKEQTSHLTRIKWTPGLKSADKRHDSVNHFDTKRNAVIILADDNGRHFDEKILGVVKKFHQCPDFQKRLKKNNIKYIDVCGKIYRPPTDQMTLDEKRDNFKKTVEEWSYLLPKMNVTLKIRDLAFPKQLASSVDVDYMVTF